MQRGVKFGLYNLRLDSRYTNYSKTVEEDFLGKDWPTVKQLSNNCQKTEDVLFRKFASFL